MNIAIIGGGIGGLATAISQRKHGFNVQVYERYSSCQQDSETTFHETLSDKSGRISSMALQLPAL